MMLAIGGVGGFIVGWLAAWYMAARVWRASQRFDA